MTVDIRALTLGAIATNCFILGDTDTGDAVLIDPVDDAPLLHRTVQDAGWTLQLILATHGHFDHVLASKDLKALSGAPFLIHENDVPFLKHLPETGLAYFGQRFPEAAVPDRLLRDAPETIQVGAIKLETIFTPGHAPGHISYWMPDERIVFSGDCLFAGSIGRTDLPGGDYDTLMRSIFDKLIPLGDDAHVLNGHGPATTIGRERATNAFLLDYANRS